MASIPNAGRQIRGMHQIDLGKMRRNDETRKRARKLRARKTDSFGVKEEKPIPLLAGSVWNFINALVGKFVESARLSFVEVSLLRITGCWFIEVFIF